MVIGQPSRAGLPGGTTFYSIMGVYTVLPRHAVNLDFRVTRVTTMQSQTQYLFGLASQLAGPMKGKVENNLKKYD